jgi:4-methylaminobutanoate oxidase (formaldehyde-forming)
MADSQANIVVIGGGAIGASVAYHLARAGAQGVVLLEKEQLTHGCTWHAAGLVGQLRSKRNLTRLMQNSVAVFDRLAEETGQVIDWHKVGSLRLASSEARWSEIKRALTQARGFDFEAHALSPEEARELFADMSIEGVVGAAYMPADGYVDPYALTQAYAKGARRNGAAIREGVAVTDLVVDKGRVTAVVTDHGTIACETVVNCAGLWARRVGLMAGVRLAAGVVEHQYLVTERKLDLPPGLTTLRDPDRNFYLKPDVNAFAIGGWESNTVSCWQSAPPWDFARTLFDSNFDRFEVIARGATERLPVLEELGVHSLINGPIPVSAWPVASRPASPPRAAPARPWPTGSSKATPAWTSGPSTCVASGPITPTPGSWRSGPSRPTASTTRSTGRATRWPRAGRPGKAPSTMT